jgi:hypothetical protein
MAFQNYASNPDEFTRITTMNMCYKGNYYIACSYINSYNLSLLEMMIATKYNENSSVTVNQSITNRWCLPTPVLSQLGDPGFRPQVWVTDKGEWVLLTLCRWN